MNYFITAIYDDNTKSRSRTFGYYSTLENAKEAVTVNRGEMHECLYNFIVIEAIDEGIHKSCSAEYWYKWTEDGWSRLYDKPEQFFGICNWAFG
jgi:hypothetical protein